MKKIFTREVKIALAGIATLVLLFFGMNFLKGLTLFSSNATYRLAFTDVKGLGKSTPVYADGYKVGTVTAIDYDYQGGGPIMVEVSLSKDLRIPAGSGAEIKSDLMGNTQVNLLLATNPRERIAEGGTIQGVEDEDAVTQVKALIPVIQAIVPKLDSIVSSANALLSNPAFLNMLQNMDATSDNLRKSTEELGRLMANVNAGVPTLVEHANNTLANTETLTNGLARIDIEGTMAKVSRTLDNVEQMTNALNNREGSLGLLMYDKALYDNLNSTISNADSLMTDMKARPSRYVHFSVFGKKDK